MHSRSVSNKENQIKLQNIVIRYYSLNALSQQFFVLSFLFSKIDRFLLVHSKCYFLVDFTTKGLNFVLLEGVTEKVADRSKASLASLAGLPPIVLGTCQRAGHATFPPGNTRVIVQFLDNGPPCRPFDTRDFKGRRSPSTAAGKRSR